MTDANWDYAVGWVYDTPEARAPNPADFEIEIPFSPSDDPGKPWRVQDANGGSRDFEYRADAYRAATESGRRAAIYRRKESEGCYWRYEVINPWPKEGK